jgi:hypothetical protein
VGVDVDGHVDPLPEFDFDGRSGMYAHKQSRGSKNLRRGCAFAVQAPSRTALARYVKLA